MAWMSCIWAAHIPPRRSILVYQILRNKVATNDNLRRCGMVLPSFCCLCMNGFESARHLFLECPFAQHIWMWLGDQFGISIGFQGDVCSLFKRCFAVCMSSQVKDLWLAAIAALCWGLWFQRNAYKFDNKKISYERLRFAIVGWVMEAGLLSKSTMSNYVSDLMIIKKFGVQCHPQRAPRVNQVNCYPPLGGWVKCNTDGLFKANVAACGGVFRNCRGFVCGIFVQHLGAESACFAEFFAVILAVEIAFSKGWTRILFEMDSALTLMNFFKPNYIPPWKLRRSW